MKYAMRVECNKMIIPSLKDYVYDELIELGIEYIEDEEKIPSTLQLYDEILEDNNIYTNIGRLNIEAMRTDVLTLNRIKLLEDMDAKYQQKLQHITQVIVEAIKTTSFP